MKTLATFANAGEAAFFQSLLADAGIAAALRDGSLDIGGVSSARLEVSEDDFERAAELINAHRSLSQEDPPKKTDEHPNARFPFLGIMGFTAIIGCTFLAVSFFVKAPSSDVNNVSTIMTFVVTISAALVQGFIVGFGVALLCLIATVTWRKLKLSLPTNSPRD